MSPEFRQRLMERLGYPTKSLFGRLILGVGQAHKPADGLTLDVAAASTIYIVDRVPEDDIDLLRLLVESLIIPDQEIIILEASPYLGGLIIATSADQVSIGYYVARKILVRPPEKTEELIAY